MTKVRARPRAATRDPEAGSAVVEFLGGSVLLLVPLVYLVLTLVQLSGAQFAASAAVREAGRLVATHGPESADLAATAVEISFRDHGITVEGAEVLTVICARDCAPGDRVHLTVTAPVQLPYAPVATTVRAETWTTVDRFREQP